MKPIILTLFLNTILSAIEVTKNQQNSILLEAALFVGVFGTMGIISYIYSSRHAKEYKKPEVEAAVLEQMSKEDRIYELLGMFEKGILTQEEYKLLHNYYRQD